jgi:putative MATE family efflux protein
MMRSSRQLGGELGDHNRGHRKYMEYTQENDQSIAMRDQSIGRLLWKFSLPAIIGMLVYALYNIVDRIFLGRGVGAIAIAASTVAFPITIVFLAISMLVAIGATALISIRLGEQKKDEAEKIVGNAVLLLTVLPLILSAVYLLFPDPILGLFGASPEVLPYARDFTHIIVIGSVFGSVGYGMNNFIRAEGNPTIAMLTQLFGALINGVLNYFFIFELGMGIKGSALATVSGQLFSALWVLGYFFSGRSVIKIRLSNFVPRMSIIGPIMAIGFAPFAMQLANSVQQLIINKTLMAFGGDLALSSVGIIMSILALLFMPIIGISQGAQPLIGYNYGAHQYHRVRETLNKAVISGIAYALVGYAAIHLWPTQIVGLFSKGDTVLTVMTVRAMLIFLAFMPTIGFQIPCANYFQAVGKPVQSAVLSLSRQILLFIPLLLILPHFWGIDGIWRAAPIADILSVLLTVVLIYREIKRMPKPSPELYGA